MKTKGISDKGFRRLAQEYEDFGEDPGLGKVPGPEFESENRTYQFSELDDRAKERATQWFMEDADLWESDAEYVIDRMKEDAPKYFEINEVHYSGFASQGDGASWTGSVDMATWFKAKGDDLGYRLAVDGIFEDANITQSGHYSHSNTMQAELLTGMYEEAEAEFGVTEDQVDDMALAAEEEVLDEAKEYADKIYKALERQYEYTYSEESLIEMADANDWRFDENGEFV